MVKLDFDRGSYNLKSSQYGLRENEVKLQAQLLRFDFQSQVVTLLVRLINE